MTAEGANSNILGSDALEFFFNSVEDQFCVLDSNLRIMRANTSFRRFVGPAGGADNTEISAYMTEKSRSDFLAIIDKLAPLETIKNLNLTMKIGRDLCRIIVTVSRSGEDVYYYHACDVTHETRIAQDRRETDEALQRIETMMGIGRWRIVKGKPSFWSPGMFRIMGMEGRETTPTFQEYTHMLPEDGAAQIKQAFDKCESTDQAMTVTTKVRRPNGEMRVVEFAGSSFCNEDGSWAGYSGIAIDKTNNLKEIQSTLQSDSTAQAFLDHAPFGVALLDADGRVSLINPAWTDIFGQVNTTLLGRKINEFWQEAPVEILNGISDACKGQISEHNAIEVTFQGRKMWMSWIASPWKDNQGRVCGTICIIRDVTKRMKDQLANKASLERMEYGLLLSSMMVWEIDVRSRQLKVEGDWQCFFNEKPSLSQLSNSLYREAHEDDKSRVSKAWKQHLCAGVPIRMSYRKKNASGREIWVSVSARQETDADGKVARMIGTMRDVTVSLKSDYLTSEAEEKAEKSYQIKSHMIADAGSIALSHLDNLNSAMDSLRRMGMTDDQIKILDLIKSSYSISSDILKDLKHYSLLNSAPIPKSEAEFKIPALIDASLDIIGAADESFKGCVAFENCDGEFKGELGQIQQALVYTLNVLNRKSVEGRISIDVDVDNSGEGLCLLMIDLTHTVSQTQSSIDVKELKQERIASLELAIIHHLVDDLKGSVSHGQSEQGDTRILLEIPIKQEFERRAVPRAASKGPARGLSLLVAEDNPLNRRVLELIANQMELNTTFVENGEEAIEAIKERPFDAVIMDTQMPIMNGLTAIRIIRKWEKDNSYHPIPIIAAIQQMSFAKVREAMAVGADDCIAKPISQEDLIAQLGDLKLEGWEVTSRKALAS